MPKTTLAALAKEARKARAIAEDLRSSSRDAAVQRLIVMTILVADELESLATAIDELGGRIDLYENFEEIRDSPS
jgi:cell division protein ZapA (FtsZ GTPase activity inhibitor)